MVLANFSKSPEALAQTLDYIKAMSYLSTDSGMIKQAQRCRNACILAV